MAILHAFRIEIPDEFPIAEWDAFFNLGVSFCPGTTDAAGEFVRSMGAVAFRFRAAHEALVSMAADWNRASGNIAFEAHYAQQRDLFSFFTCLQSSVESALYACYVVLAHMHPAKLTWSNLKTRRRYFTDELPALLAAAYSAGACELEGTVRRLAGSSEWAEIDDFRNLLIHRSLPSRLVEGVGGGGPPPMAVMVKYAASWSTPELRATEAQMTARLEWLATQLRTILSDATKL